MATYGDSNAMAAPAAAGGQTVVVVQQPQQLMVAAFTQSISDTIHPNAIGVVHKQPFNDKWICFQCNPFCALCAAAGANPGMAVRMFTCQSLCDYFCWEKKLKPRAYAAVHENRVEFNYPFTYCCGMCVGDYFITQHFDTMPSITHAQCCTPYHCCYFVECFGGVIAEAPCACVNNPVCSCCRTYFPGLSNAPQFMMALEQAKNAALNNQRIVMVRP